MPIYNKQSLFIESYGELIKFDDLMANFDASITYLLNPSLQLDFAFGTGMNHSMNFITAGISWRTGMKK